MTQNIKHKMIEAMDEHRQTCANYCDVVTMGGLLDAALAVLVDLENWDKGTDLAEYTFRHWLMAHATRAFITYIRDQEASHGTDPA